MSKGVFISVFGSVLFGSLFYLVTLLAPLAGFEILGWRILFMAVILTVYMLLHHDLSLARAVIAQVPARPWRLPAMALCAALVGLQFWLFVWAPLNGMALEVSLGYFLFPLSLVLCGRVLYKDRLSRLQKIAVLFAVVGVANQLYFVGHISWATLVVCVAYPPYFILRRYLGTDNLGGFWWDLFLLCPLAVWFICGGPTPMPALFGDSRLLLLLAAYGVISGIAMTCFILASRLLTMSLFGLLNYVEPVLLALVAFMLGSSIQEAEWLTYIGIWLAVLMLVADGALNVIRHHRLIGAQTDGPR